MIQNFNDYGSVETAKFIYDFDDFNDSRSVKTAKLIFKKFKILSIPGALRQLIFNFLRPYYTTY